MEVNENANPVAANASNSKLSVKSGPFTEQGQTILPELTAHIHTGTPSVPDPLPCEAPTLDGGRRIVAEDSQWNLASVASLTSICVDAIVKRFEEQESITKIPVRYLSQIINLVSVDSPLLQIVNIIPDDSITKTTYWNRRASAHFPDASVHDHGMSFKRMYCELTLQQKIAMFLPNIDNFHELSLVARLLCPFIYRLVINQLQPSRSDILGMHDQHANHLDPCILVDNLDSLTHISLHYGVLNAGINFEWRMFGMTRDDSLKLSQSIGKCCWTSLALSRSGIDDSKLTTLCEGIRDCPFLETLKLDHNKIGDKGVTSLSRILTMSTCVLRDIDLGNNQVGPIGASHLAKALTTIFQGKKPTVNKLGLRLNPLQSQGVCAITLAIQQFRKHAPYGICVFHLDLAATSMGIDGFRQCCALIEHDLVRNMDICCNTFIVSDTLQLQTDQNVVVPSDFSEESAGLAADNKESHSSTQESSLNADDLGAMVWNCVQKSKELEYVDIRCTDLPASTINTVQEYLSQQPVTLITK